MDMGEMGTYDEPPKVPIVQWLLYVRVADIDAGGVRAPLGPEG